MEAWWEVGIHGEAGVGNVKDEEEEEKRIRGRRKQGSPVCRDQSKKDEKEKRWKKTRVEMSVAKQQRSNEMYGK